MGIETPDGKLSRMDLPLRNSIQKKHTPTSTVGRGRAVKEISATDMDLTKWSDELISVELGDSLKHYHQWETPTAIVSDGGYGILGFEGDTSDHLALPQWYEPHVTAW